MRRSIVIITAVIVLATIAVGLGGCGVEQAATAAAAVAPSSTAAPAAKTAPAASSETLRFVKRTMPKLEKIRRLWNDGSYDAAVKLWKSIKDIPVNTAADSTFADVYLAYANNVRYWMMDDGSCNMKQLEASRDKAMAAWREYR